MNALNEKNVQQVLTIYLHSNYIRELKIFLIITKTKRFEFVHSGCKQQNLIHIIGVNYTPISVTNNLMT